MVGVVRILLRKLMDRLVKHGDVRVIHDDLVAAKDSLHFVARFTLGESNMPVLWPTAKA